MTKLERIESWLARHCLIAALCAGAVARAVSSVVGIGFHARDDYFHVLAPALAWLQDPSFDWAASGIPGAGLRSELVPRIVEGVVWFSEHIGIHEPEGVLRVLHAAFGAYSLLTIVATYLLVQRLADARTMRIATWLAALHFAMPYLGTRLLIEAIAMPPLVFGLYFATFPTVRRALVAGLLIGIACWLRYQVAVIAVGVAIVMAIRKHYRAVAGLALGGTIAIAVQAGFDVLTGYGPLQPLLANIAYNAHPPAALTRTSAWAYPALWLLLTIPPATFVLLPAMWRAAKPLIIVWLPFVLFVIAHMVVPHKEERFMAPALPLFLILLAAGLAAGVASLGPAGQRIPRGRRWLPASVGGQLVTAMAVWFVAVHVLMLGITVTYQAQAGQRRALTAIREDAGATALIAMGPEVPEFYLGRRTLPVARASDVDAVWLRHTMRDLDDQGTPANRFMAFASDALKVTILLEAMELDCPQHALYEGSPLDVLVYRLNPEHNRRRAPIVVWSCDHPDVALRDR